ncbi:MscS Mechanosensitive ion channel [Thalassoporum mexicanum PCC 7367]|uniref:mechanosensitive ion channel domain-containing protein n=1 Tax=Thalassoporum mexicanum TaxID=3457544 RepID=UPI00029F9E6F|nr:mechanosensitive ion channel domain-containing protein [Pseudanabaena sp. PCC 7367]AFY71312.1 MscS Mechanosensitive ion channel [Pseudanabaena sp. PCC 7367]
MFQGIQNFVEEFLDILKTPLFTLGNTDISITSFLLLCFYLVIIFILARTLRQFLRNRVLSRAGFDSSNREIVSAILSYGIGAIAAVMVLQTIGINIASLAVLAGGLGIGIGFGFQDVTKNFVSGVTILLERKLKVGDFVEFDGLEGYVREISIRSTIIRTLDRGDVVVPNSQLVENRVLNWSYDSFTARIRVPVGVDYSSDPVAVTEALLDSAYMEPAVLLNPAPKVFFRGFGDSALNFELRVWINRIDDRDPIISSLNFIIEYNLRQQGISIPFPQRDLWIKNPESLRNGASHKTELPALTPLNSEGQPVEPASRPLPLRDLLRRVAYFEHFSELELRELIEIGYRRRLHSGDVLFREGDPGDSFYIILSGLVEVFVQKLDKSLCELGVGEFFGELSLMLSIPRTASIRAIDETMVFVISHRGFEKLLHAHADLAENIVQELGKRKDELAERQDQLRAMGLVGADEDDKNPVEWVRKRLKRLFKLDLDTSTW